jgi:hypothetical protein
MFSQMCRDCKEERARALAGSGPFPDDPDAWEPSLYPPCASEWMVGPVDQHDEGVPYVE